MIAAFPEMFPKIFGKPILRKLIWILNTHIIPCTHIHMTTISLLGLLYIYIPPAIYGKFTADAYPVPPQDPGP